MNNQPRLPALDSLRGLLIVLMIAEHARQILGGGVLLETPGHPISAPGADIASVVRLLSHLCAPGFFFLLGVGMVLHIGPLGDTRRDARRRFIKRGLGLIVLQVTVENFGWFFPNLWRNGLGAGAETPLYLGVLFGLGGSLILASCVLTLSDVKLLLLATGMIVSSHLQVPANAVPWVGWLTQGNLNPPVEVLYPLLPWTGISLLGILFARHGIRDGRIRPRAVWSVAIGAAACSAAWSGGTLALGAPGLSNWTKYPPALTYTLGTLAVLLLLLAIFVTIPSSNRYPLQLAGRHSLFFYLVHLYVLGFASFWVSRPDMPQVLAIAAGVVLLGLGGCWWREKTVSPGHGVNPFDCYHRLYDRFMHRVGLYRVQDVRRSMVACRAQGALLDVGGGTGYLASQLTDLFSTIIVNDTSAGMLSAARRRNLQTCQASAVNLPFPARHFDAVLCTDALHHIKHTDQAIAEMSRVLKPGGIIVVLEFHIRGPDGWLFFCFERLFIDRSEFLTPAQLRSCAVRHGLEGTIRPISRLEYIFEGRKPIEGSIP